MGVLHTLVIYITIRNQRSPSVKNVSWVWKSSWLFSLFGLGIDRKRVNGNYYLSKILELFLDLWNVNVGVQRHIVSLWFNYLHSYRAGLRNKYGGEIRLA